jgi:hypothetical protein
MIHPGNIQASSGGGGAGTVTTDGTTIDGDGSVGDPITLVEGLYENTVFVSKTGDASVSGKNPAKPTTFANAMSNLVFNQVVVLFNSDTAYTTGGTIAISANNVTFKSDQGGTGSNSVIISDPITLTGTRFRAFGVRFDGNISDTSAGSHYYTECSWGSGTTYTRTNPEGTTTFTSCDQSSCSYVVTGTATGVPLTVFEGGAGQVSSLTLGTTNHLTFVLGIRFTGQVVLTAGTFEARNTAIIHATLPVNASAGTSVTLRNTTCTNALSVVKPITVSGDYVLQDCKLDIANSTLGTSGNGASVYTGSLQAGSKSNYTEVETDGTLHCVGDGTGWQDVNFEFSVDALSGAGNKPDPVTWGSTSIQRPGFDDGTEEEVDRCFEIPHEALLNVSTAVFHVHWGPATAGSGVVRWGLEYFFIGEGETKTTATTIYVNDTASETAWRRQTANFAAISIPNELGTQLSFRFFRDATDGADTYGADAVVLTAGLHFEADTPAGSRGITSK